MVKYGCRDLTYSRVQLVGNHSAYERAISSIILSLSQELSLATLELDDESSREAGPSNPRKLQRKDDTTSKRCRSGTSLGKKTEIQMAKKKEVLRHVPLSLSDRCSSFAYRFVLSGSNTSAENATFMSATCVDLLNLHRICGC